MLRANDKAPVAEIDWTEAQASKLVVEVVLEPTGETIDHLLKRAAVSHAVRDLERKHNYPTEFAIRRFG